MKKFYSLVSILFFIGLFHTFETSAQLTATFQSYESRCAATGAIKIVATGGSGSYQYKVQGPININFTDKDSITGLSSGSYTVTVNDIVNNKTFSQANVVVNGSYADPRFGLDHVDVSCDNGYNGSITVQNVQYGRSPFTYSIVAPSPMGIGTSNSTGIFTDLKAGNYSIQMRDSCGGIQTRTVTINDYSWDINTVSFTKTSCDLANGSITVMDSKNNFTPIPGFLYGVVRSPGDTIWNSTGIFNNITVTGINTIDIVAKDICGNIKKRTLSSFLIPRIDSDVKISNTQCKTFDVELTGIRNFFSPVFSLYNSTGDKIDENSTGKFTSVPYGAYCIKAKDACTDTIITRCFSKYGPIVSISDNVEISNKNCNTFSASIKNQQNLTNPQYFLIHSITGDTITFNNTGIFNNLIIGTNYCILTKDGCVDTTIRRCFFVDKPIPIIPDSIAPSYITCNNFGLNIKGDSLTNPLYCLYDSSHTEIGCNTNGIADSLPLGFYYITIHDACRDTTIYRTIDVSKPIVTNDIDIDISNKTCTTFTATASSSNLTQKQFCLYKSVDSSLIVCNSTGIFDGLNYEEGYYLKTRNQCPDTTMINSFSIVRDIPTVNSDVKITSRQCSSFTAEITGQKNLINPQYCLIDTTAHDTLACNNTGKFDNLLPGSYLIQIISGCNDTLKVYFSQASDTLLLQASASRSCNYGYTKFNFNVNGVLPVNIKIYAPGNFLIIDSSFNNTNFSIDNIPNITTNDKFTIVGTDACGNRDTLQLAPIIGYLNHTPSVIAKCPGSVWPNGSGNINIIVKSNLPNVSVKIIAKDGTSYSKSPDYSSGSNYIFNDLGPGSYVIRYKADDNCNVNLYDTVFISDYKFPNLSRSTVYQCDTIGFSVGAVVSNGVAPFIYEIIGSSPDVPSLISAPQPNPIFKINNGTTYSLIRLRATDACGNATLADASILPLADNGIKTSLNCFQNPATLSVDTIYNATYSWFMKTNIESTDSIPVSDGTNYYITNVLPTDTGIYTCYINVLNGCVNRTYNFHLDGSCFKTLPLNFEGLSGKFIDKKVLLNWKINNANELADMIIERKVNNIFVEIGHISPTSQLGETNYKFIDEDPGSQNFYRIKLISKDNTPSYSNIILVQRQITSGISIYPNPSTDIVNLEFYATNNHIYKIALLNILNQKIKEITFKTEDGNKLQIKRTRNMPDGMYILHFTDMNTNEQFSQKIIFKSK